MGIMSEHGNSSGKPSAGEIGHAVLRWGIGFMFLLHGWPKLIGGPDRWAGIGKAMENFGITFAPAFWGFMAGATEFFGGLLLIVGIAVRPAGALLLFVMLVASIKHLSQGDGIMGASHAIEAGIVFLSLLISGDDQLSLIRRLKKND
jgi:putative oxidoreductase